MSCTATLFYESQCILANFGLLFGPFGSTNFRQRISPILLVAAQRNLAALGV